MTARDRLQLIADQVADAPSPPAAHAAVRSLYFALLGSQREQGQANQAAARAFLLQQLEATRSTPCDLPEDPNGLTAWLEESVTRTGRQYREYVEQRKAGAPRRFFSSRAHALHFLRAVAPTKMVDGAWLYGLLAQWQDPRLAPLLRTYLEELGDGLPHKNHVLLYSQLLAAHGCEDWQDQPDALFLQGAIQLALAQLGDEFLPEVIGFNLGYEQLPLHLPITAYELKELGIDPYYFSLHVTVDNAATGHARKAVGAVLAALPELGDRAEFFRRVADGYRLNALGVGSNQVIAGFDLEQALLEVFKSKAEIGALLHGDRCRVAGKTVSAWLSEPGQLPVLLRAMEQSDWIRRGKDPRNSRFWQLLEGERALMFGVFTPYELALIHEWISSGRCESGRPARHASLTLAAAADTTDAISAAERRSGSRSLERFGPSSTSAKDMHGELRMLEERLARSANKDEAMATLIPLLSPARHWHPLGLMATRIASKLLA